MPCDDPNARPTRCRENNDSNSPGCKVLLIPEIGVGGNKYLEPLLFGRTQQLTILQSSPAKLISSEDTVIRERLPQRNRCSLVKQNSHLCGQQSRPGCVLQNVTSLRQGNAGEPLNELMDRGVFFEVLEERGNRNPRASENPGTTYAIRVALDIGASRPINHGRMVALWAEREKETANE